MRCRVLTNSGSRSPGLRVRQRPDRRRRWPVVVIDTAMKLRLQGNSLRLRLTRSEVARLDDYGTVEEAASFRSGGSLTYRIQTASFRSGGSLTYRIQSRTGTEPLYADFSGGAITVLIPIETVRAWADRKS